MVCASEGDTPKTKITHEITMFRRFIPNPQAKAFQPSKKILDIVEASKVDASELEEKTPLDPDIESKLIWRHFNVIKPGENVDERGRIQGTPKTITFAELMVPTPSTEIMVATSFTAATETMIFMETDGATGVQKV